MRLCAPIVITSSPLTPHLPDGVKGGSSLEQGRFDQPSQAAALSHAAEGPVSAFTGGGAGFHGSAPVTVRRGFVGLQLGFVFDVGLSGSYSHAV